MGVLLIYGKSNVGIPRCFFMILAVGERDTTTTRNRNGNTNIRFIFLMVVLSINSCSGSRGIVDDNVIGNLTSMVFCGVGIPHATTGAIFLQILNNTNTTIIKTKSVFVIKRNMINRDYATTSEHIDFGIERVGWRIIITVCQIAIVSNGKNIISESGRSGLPFIRSN